MTDSDTESAESCEFVGDYGSAEERIDFHLPFMPVESDESDVSENGSQVDTPFMALASPLLGYSPYVAGQGASERGKGELLPLVGPGGARNGGETKTKEKKRRKLMKDKNTKTKTKSETEKGCTFNQTTANMINYMVGLVMMSLPNSFTKLGWIASLASFFGASFERALSDCELLSGAR